MGPTGVVREGGEHAIERGLVLVLEGDPADKVRHCHLNVELDEES